MQLGIHTLRGRRIKIGVAVLAAAALTAVFWRPLVRVGGLVFGAALIAFLAEPLARWLERRLSRRLSALLSLLALALLAGGALWLLLPAMFREIVELAGTLPETLAQVSATLDHAAAWLEARLPGLSIPEIDWSAANGFLSSVASGTFAVAVNLAGIAGTLSLMAVLAYFLLCDRERLLLRLELLLPQAFRHTAVCMGNAVCREWRLYLRGQLLIALAVTVLAGAGLMLVGVRSALVLGPVVGILNMIPYFGPYIGGAPAVLIALGDGWPKAAMAALVLVIVQQLDNSVISPRILGSVTGFSPALVLVGIYAGARVGGVTGMLLALPVMMTARTLYRVFIQKS